MIQPIIVRAVGLRYQLIAGERRLRASIEAQLHEIPARVLDLDDQRVFELAMVENLQREDLNAIDKAGAFRDYLSRYGGTQEELAGRLGIDRSTVSNLIRLLELPDEILDAVRSNQISQGHARRAARPGGARDAARRLPTGRDRTPLRPPDRGARQHRRPHPESSRESARTRPMARMPGLPISSTSSRRCIASLGTTVTVRARSPERGQIVIDYHSREEFDRLTALLRARASVAGDRRGPAGSPGILTEGSCRRHAELRRRPLEPQRMPALARASPVRPGAVPRRSTRSGPCRVEH